MEILFMTGLFPKEMESAVRSKIRVDMFDADNVLEWNLVEGLEENGGLNLSLLNLLPINSWPQYYCSPFVPRRAFAHKPGAEDVNVGFCNVKYIKIPLMGVACTREAKCWEKRTRGDEKRAVLLYSLKPAFLRAAEWLKKKDPAIKVVAIVADLPEFVLSKKNVLRRWYAGHVEKQVSQYSKSIDGFVLLSKHMADRLGVIVPYTVMEGIAKIPTQCEEPIAASAVGKKRILYTGRLNTQYGITILVDAFMQLADEEMELVLCGLGDAEPYVRACAEKDGRIKYLGKIPHGEVRVLQQSATVVVNPRQNNEEFTKYSFPSKTMEYLASGVPLVAYKLSGIPDEYDEYIHYVPDNSPETLAAVLQRVCSQSEEERRTFAERGKQFVLEKKNRVAQTRKILELIKAL